MKKDLQKPKEKKKERGSCSMKGEAAHKIWIPGILKPGVGISPMS